MIYIKNNYDCKEIQLSTHPECLGKQVAVKGRVSFLVNWGCDLTLNLGTDYYFIEEGGDTPGDDGDDTPGEEGDGSEANPYTIEQVLAMDQVDDMKWVKGYLVGVAGGSVNNWQPIFGVPNEQQASAYPHPIIAGSTDCQDVKQALVLYTCTNELLKLGTKPEQLGKLFAVQISNVILSYNAACFVTEVKELAEEDPGEDPGEEATEIVIDFTQKGYNNADDIVEFTQDGITLVPSKGTNNSNGPKYYTGGTAARFYGNNTLTVSTSSEKFNIVKIDFVTEASNPFTDGSNKASVGKITVESTTAATWADSNGAKSVVITPKTGTSGQVRIQKMTVYLGEPGEQFAEAPVFTPEDEVISKNSLVTLSSATEGAVIYYTTNGNDPKPGESGTLTYTAPGIYVTASTTIKAIATAEGMSNSQVVTKTYTVPAEFKTLQALMAGATQDGWYKFTGVLTVTYANGANCFVKDNTGSMLLYGNALRDMELASGTIIKDVIGKYDLRYDMIPQLKDIVSTSTPLSGSAVDPVASTVADVTAASMSEYLIISNAVITKHPEQDNTGNKYAQNYWTITDETGSKTLYNQFGVEVAATPEGKVADVVVIPSYYGNDIQLYVISYTEKDAPQQGGLEDGDGTEANPYTIEQVLAMDEVKDMSWVKGYLVGVGGGSFVNMDVIFGVPNEQQVNAFPHPLLAGSADCKDKTQILALLDCANPLLALGTNPGQLGKLFAAQVSQCYPMFNAAFLTTAVKELGGGSVGIAGVEADTNAPVEYFNLQGMPVGADNL
ncbi:MAG: chitobiase/beta-hexosaminidase C-terminal domain-containing protein, partial [Muribaculaceae bacterium]|nr:chitobiase/beta-hexosaminidase C-terminal domain-containing protein [Muribaculaceae bacterium]